MSSTKPAITVTVGLVSRQSSGSCSSPRVTKDVSCDACPFCMDVCDSKECTKCAAKMQCCERRRSNVLTRCQVRRHASAESCWLVAGNDVYDVTSFVPRHPAGTFSIVRHSGGRDCSEDLQFHSSKAQKLWARHKIGRLVPCPSEADSNGDKNSPSSSNSNCVIS